jgi:hypothetical protein
MLPDIAKSWQGGRFPLPLIQAELLYIIHNVELAVHFVPLSMLPDIAKSWQGCTYHLTGTSHTSGTS